MADPRPSISTPRRPHGRQLACEQRLVWRAEGSWKHELQALRLSVFPCLAWCSGTRHWAATELRTLGTAQLRMTLRYCGWWPRGDEPSLAQAKRTARWAERLWAEARIPPWDAAVATKWWRRAAWPGSRSASQTDGAGSRQHGATHGGGRPLAESLALPHGAGPVEAQMRSSLFREAKIRGGDPHKPSDGIRSGPPPLELGTNVG